MATVMLSNGSGVLLAITCIAIVLINGGRSAAATALAGANNKEELINGMSSENDVMDFSNAANLAAMSNLLASSRADLRTLFPAKKDLLRFVLTHRQPLLRALERQRQRQLLEQQDADDENFDDNGRPDLYYYDPSVEAEQRQATSFEPSQKRAQATYLRFGRSARLRFGKRASSLFDDVILGNTRPTAERRSASARLRFG